MTGVPGPHSTDIELLECIDEALRNGRNMTRANLAFDYLLDRFGYGRMDILSYAAEMKAQEEADREYLAAHHLPGRESL